MVVHEFFIIHLKAVANTERLTLANVFDSGGHDTKWREAESKAAANFRSFRDKPEGPTTTGDGYSGPAKPWNCAFNKDSVKTCNAFNLKRNHLNQHLDAGGRCIFKHACDQFVVGPNGEKTTCGSLDHGRTDCKHPNKWTAGDAGGGK